MSRTELTGAQGRLRASFWEPPERTPGAPLLVCIHGGGTNGSYFDLKGNSTLAAARARGMPVLLPNRPGFGGSSPPLSDTVIDEAAELIADLIGEVLPRARADAVVVIGHSIGGAVALTMVARGDPLPFRGVAVSGIGDRPSAEADRWLEGVLAGGPPEPPAAFFFGPEGTYGWRGPAALRQSGETWRRDEVVEVMIAWPQRFAAIAAAVDVPVQFRLAEHEHIWDAGPAALDRVTRALARAPLVDAALLPDGGHLYEAHKRGPELVAGQLAFLAGAAVACPAPTAASAARHEETTR